MNKIVIDRQGDVPVIAMSGVDPDIIRTEGKRIVPENGQYIIKHGEKTGHTHTIEERPDIEVIEWKGATWVLAEKDWSLDHQQHGTIVFAPIPSQIAIQVEATDDDDGIRLVID